MEEGMQKKWLDVEKVRNGLDSATFGRDIKVYDVLESTNSQARVEAGNGENEGTIIIARTQKSGYGRLKRRWYSPEGGLWFSIIMRPKLEPQEAATITLMAGVAVSESLNDLYHINATIKWPNDVIIGRKKICGIVTEMRTKGTEIEYAILGVGINADFGVSSFPQELRDGTTTLKDELKTSIELEYLLIHIINRISKYFEILNEGDFDTILNRWRELSDTIGRRVKIEMYGESIEGLAKDLDEKGALIVKNDSGISQKIFAGDCIHLTVSEGNL